MLFTLTACGNKEKEKNNEEYNGTKNVEGRLIIGDYDLTLNENGSFSKINFRFPHDCEISNPITSLIINCTKKDSDESLIRIAMGDMYGTKIEESMNGFTKVGSKTINGINWAIYKSKDGKNNYGINVEYSNIVIGFIYEDESLSKFEEEFMNNITLNK